MRCRVQFYAFVVWLMVGAMAAYGQGNPSMAQFAASPLDLQDLPAIMGAVTPCVDGEADGFDCNSVDLMAFVPNSTFGAGSANDIWGWTDPQTGDEYAIVGLNNGTAFVDVTDPENPVYVGKLPTHTSSSLWRDVKVYNDHAFIVSEASGHGVQVFDLTQLRNVANPPETFSNTAHYGNVNDVHNIAINEDTGFAYTVGNNGGGTTCAGGLHMIDISTPAAPVFAGCYSGDGYTHDAQCVVYNGPDVQHQGKEICFNSNEDTVTIVDVSNKSNPIQLSRTGYPTSSYVHQGWLTDDQTIFYQNDELDGGNTRTLVWDVVDLDAPEIVNEYIATTTSKDHNLYVVGNLLYETNYTTGLRVLNIDDPVNPVEIGFFDTYTPNNGGSFDGAWSNYPYFASGNIIVSSIGEGLFVLKPDASPNPPGGDFTITLKRVFTKNSGVQKAKIKWDAAEISTNKIDFYIAEDPAQPDPAGNQDKRIKTSKEKIKLTIPVGGGGPVYNIMACEKNSSTVCSNMVQADFTNAPVIGPNDPDYYDNDGDGASAAKGAVAASEAVPERFALQSNYPNPFNPTTSIRMDLPEAAQVSVAVFDLLGRQVMTTPVVSLAAGASRSVTLDASALSSGTYVYRVTARMKDAVETGTGRMVLVK